MTEAALHKFITLLSKAADQSLIKPPFILVYEGGAYVSFDVVVTPTKEPHAQTQG